MADDYEDAFNAAVAQGQAGAGSAAGGSTGMVYFGGSPETKEVYVDYGNGTGHTYQAHGSDMRSLDAAKDYFYDMVTDPAKIDGFRKTLYEIGYLDEETDTGLEALQTAWDLGASLSAKFNQTKGLQVTPEDALRMWARGNGEGTAFGPAAEAQRQIQESPHYGEDYSVSQRRKDINLLDPLTARALVNNMASKLLGRYASDDDVEEFTKILNKRARQNPSITDITTNYEWDAEQEGHQVTQTETTQKGGFSEAAAQQLLEDQMADDPESQAYRAGGTYFNILQQALQGDFGGQQ